MPSLEERVEQLEMFRYRALGRLNALQALVLSSALRTIRRSDDPRATLQRLQEERERWARDMDITVPEGTTVDRERAVQETRAAMEVLTGLLAKALETYGAAIKPNR